MLNPKSAAANRNLFGAITGFHIRLSCRTATGTPLMDSSVDFRYSASSIEIAYSRHYFRPLAKVNNFLDMQLEKNQN